MNKYGVVALAALCICVLAGAALAQAPSGPPKPGPEHQKLAYFAGKWASEGEMKAGAFGPGGKFTFTETCEWYAGSFALVCNSEGMMQGSTVKGLSVISYDPGEKTYIYFETNSTGENVFSHGAVEGDTWTWNNEGKMYGKPTRARFTMKQVSSDTAAYKFEMATGDEPLKLVMEGKQTRAK